MAFCKHGSSLKLQTCAYYKQCVHWIYVAAQSQLAACQATLMQSRARAYLRSFRVEQCFQPSWLQGLLRIRALGTLRVDKFV